MKKIQKLCFLALVGLMVGTSCEKTAPEPENNCFKGVVIGKIRSNGGGLAVSMEKTNLSTHTWRGYSNVVEALGLGVNVAPNSVIYFNARPANVEEKNFIVTADGDESAKPIVVASNVSPNSCK